MKYEVVLECEIEGTTRTPGDVGEHPEDVVSELIKEGKVRVIPEDQTVDPSTTNQAVDNSQPNNQDNMLNNTDNTTTNTNTDATQTNGSDQTTNQTDAQRVLAQTDLDTNPILGELDAQVGDTVCVHKQ